MKIIYGVIYMDISKEVKNGKYKMLFIIGIVFIVLTVVVTGIIRYSKDVTDSISKQVIRFHVVANSDTTEDQLLKQNVRDEVIEFIEPLISKCETVEDTRYILEGSLPVIEEISKEVVENWGKDYQIYVALDKANFPTKSYGDVVLPAGEYEACRIVIGEGKGENWWCVMYPPLCYLDVATGVVPLEGKEQLENELNEEQYKLITDRDHKKYEIKFKLVESINSLMHKSDYQTKH